MKSLKGFLGYNPNDWEEMIMKIFVGLSQQQENYEV